MRVCVCMFNVPSSANKECHHLIIIIYRRSLDPVNLMIDDSRERGVRIKLPFYDSMNIFIENRAPAVCVCLQPGR